MRTRRALVIYEKLIKPFAFRMDAERAHNLALWLIENGFVTCAAPNEPHLRTTLFQHPIPHPLGLAAGFDKNGTAIDQWRGLGFSFAEIGTVTPKPQPGNEKPRLFRLVEDGAIINRMGFNSHGAAAVSKRLEQRQTRIPIGVNIGKNKTTPNEKAAEEYVECAERLAPVADYLVINVSSPNTPGIRDLQTPSEIRTLLQRLHPVSMKRPILIKLSPDSSDADLCAAAGAALESGAQGFVLTNTTTDRSGLSSTTNEQGGVSGKPLRCRAVDVCKRIRREFGRNFAIIGVGGVFTGADLLERLKAGADVCQIYTAFAFRGPCTARKILEELQQQMA